MSAFALAILLLAQDEGSVLRYAGERGTKAPVTVEVTLDLDFKGSDVAVNYIRSTSAFFTFSRIHWRADGERRIDRVDGKTGMTTQRTEFAQARVDGTYDDEKYEYDFDRAAPPSDLKDDKLKGILWGIIMNGHPQTLTPAGDLRAVDPNQDAFGEALMLLAWPVARLSDKAVKAGDAWESKWRGARKDKQNQSQFDYAQKARLEKSADGRVEIAFDLSATGAAAGNASQKIESRGRVVLDTKTGIVAAWESEGRVTVSFKGTDPGSGDEVEATVTFTVTSKGEPK